MIYKFFMSSPNILHGYYDGKAIENVVYYSNTKELFL